jgi:hypothetical protein
MLDKSVAQLGCSDNLQDQLPAPDDLRALPGGSWVRVGAPLEAGQELGSERDDQDLGIELTIRAGHPGDLRGADKLLVTI